MCFSDTKVISKFEPVTLPSTPSTNARPKVVHRPYPVSYQQVHSQWRIQGGAPGVSPLRTKIFLISCSFSEILVNLYVGAPVLEGWRPLIWGIMDPSLTSIDIQKDTEIAYPLIRRGKTEIEKCILSYVCVQKITVVTKSPQLRISPHRRNVIFRNENQVQKRTVSVMQSSVLPINTLL